MSRKLNKQCKNTFEQIKLRWEIFAMILFIVCCVVGIYVGIQWVDSYTKYKHDLCDQYTVDSLFCYETTTSYLNLIGKPYPTIMVFWGMLWRFVLVTGICGLIGSGIYYIIRIE